jgi:hypothetical protein
MCGGHRLLAAAAARLMPAKEEEKSANVGIMARLLAGAPPAVKHKLLQQSYDRFLESHFGAPPNTTTTTTTTTTAATTTQPVAHRKQNQPRKEDGAASARWQQEVHEYGAGQELMQNLRRPMSAMWRSLLGESPLPDPQLRGSGVTVNERAAEGQQTETKEKKRKEKDSRRKHAPLHLALP